MAYLLGTHLTGTSKVRIALTQVYGIGVSKACQVCDQLGLSTTITINQLTRIQTDQISRIITQTHLIDSELTKMLLHDIQRLLQISCYRGLRHSSGLPLRGQRTHTNAKTSRKLKRSFNKRIYE